MPSQLKSKAGASCTNRQKWDQTPGQLGSCYCLSARRLYRTRPPPWDYVQGYEGLFTGMAPCSSESRAPCCSSVFFHS